MSGTQQAGPAVSAPPAPGPGKERDGRTRQRPLALQLLARPEAGVFLGAIAADHMADGTELAALKHELAQVRGVGVEELPEEEDLTAPVAAGGQGVS
jgi:hypothetical protein